VPPYDWADSWWADTLPAVKSPVRRRLRRIVGTPSPLMAPAGAKILAMEPSEPPGHEPKDANLLEALHHQLHRLEQMMDPPAAARSIEKHLVPAWRRATEGEHRLPVALAVGVAIALQLVLPGRLVIGPAWVLPTLEGLLMIGLIAANPRRINRTSRTLRAASIALIALISLANAWATGALIYGLINGTEGASASILLSRAASVYITNVIVFGLWYWEWDRGGPVAQLHRLPVRVVHQRHRIQPDRHHAPFPMGEDADASAVGGRPPHRGLRGRPGGQHSQIANTCSV
jgi:hypothetical protein